MIELRWYVPVVGDKVLQYRQKYNATIYAGMPTQEQMNQTANMQWSKWTDVPLESERDPNFP
jgi:hypothetical protein